MATTFTTVPSGTPIGALLRTWRQRRRCSQLDLALDTEISQRHLSFVESGRASPSRDMVLRLAEQLDVPLRERNALLLAAGYAPLYAERPLDDPAMRMARGTMERILQAHLPHPALVVDRHWHMVAANTAVAPLLAGVTDPALLTPPVNVLRLSLHPLGLAPCIANLAEWRAHLLDRLRRQVAANADPVLASLLVELAALEAPPPDAASGPLARDSIGQTPSRSNSLCLRGRFTSEVGSTSDDRALGGIAVPLELDTAQGRLSLISTTTVFGTPTEVTLSELAIEAFYPADDDTAERLHRMQQT